MHDGKVGTDYQEDSTDDINGMHCSYSLFKAFGLCAEEIAKTAIERD